MRNFHEIPMIATKRGWERVADDMEAARVRNLIIAGLCGAIICVLIIVWVAG